MDEAERAVLAALLRQALLDELEETDDDLDEDDEADMKSLVDRLVGAVEEWGRRRG